MSAITQATHETHATHATHATHKTLQVWGVCLALAALVLIVFGQTLEHGFVNYDDNEYVTDNPVVQKGITFEGLRWAAATGVIGHWHPLTWVSHMLDCQWYGLNPGAHHLTNVLLHGAAAILLFLALRSMTGSLWPSAFVAAVFAIHPLKAESVAWISERKDVLSGLFFMLTLWAYGRYAQKRGRASKAEGREPLQAQGVNLEGRCASADGRQALDTRRSTLDYLLVLIFFSLGLLSKSMLVTLPLVLLLLDYWPLGRLPNLSRQTVFPRVAEKVPLLLLSAASCVATFLAPEQVLAADRMPLGLRLENAATACVVYLRQLFYPAGLACFYPNPVHDLPPGQLLGAAVLLLAVTGVAYVFRKKRPYVIVGWLWYLGMLTPVIGIVQISLYAHADRYTYLPHIGLYVALAWAATELSDGWRHRRIVLGALGTAILVVLVVCARTQTSYWRDSETLWSHAVGCTAGNVVAHMDLGNALLEKGGVDQAIAQYERALQIAPDNTGVHHNLGIALLEKGNAEAAVVHLQKAAQAAPEDGEVRYQLGNAFRQKGELDEAIRNFENAVQLCPDLVPAWKSLGYAFAEKGSMGPAIACLQKTVQIRPGDAEARNNLAWLLATTPEASLRDGARAVALAELANRSGGGNDPNVLHTLAAAYAEAGRFADAAQTARRAMELARAAGQADLVSQLDANLRLYEAGQPFHEQTR